MNMIHQKTRIFTFLIAITVLLTSCAKQEVNEPRYQSAENVPQFTESEITTVAFESYSELDELGRCGPAMACIGEELMPTEERGTIGQIKPSGWQLVKYDIVDGKYLYNRCHLIGYQLSGENANEKNLITGTRYLNTNGMLPYENMVADYIRETKNHVMYRVTPVFEGDNLVANGVRMEAFSVEDNGKGISFNVFVENIQPGVIINYLDGTSKLESEKVPVATDLSNEVNVVDKTDVVDETGVSDDATDSDQRDATTYILNTNTMKFHYAECSSVKDMKPENKETFTGEKTWLTDNGYSPCGRCKP